MNLCICTYEHKNTFKSYRERERERARERESERERERDRRIDRETEIRHQSDKTFVKTEKLS